MDDDLAKGPPNVGRNLVSLEPGHFLLLENVAHLPQNVAILFIDQSVDKRQVVQVTCYIECTLNDRQMVQVNLSFLYRQF